MNRLVFCFLFLITITLISCGGTLTDEQRKRLHEGMERNTIKKLSDVQITEAAFAMGRSLSAVIESTSADANPQLDSIAHAHHVKIIFLQPGDKVLLDVEQQIIEAYTAGSDSIVLNDNVQAFGKDSLLYTKPIMKKLPTGTMIFAYAVGIHLPKKEVVLSIKE